LEKPPLVSVIIPTLRESQNIPLVLGRLDAVLAGFEWEVVFVDDDSDDGTAEVLVNLTRTNRRVRFIRRIGRRGLSSACLEGMATSAADFFAVMDADLQHDERILPVMIRALADDPNLELAIGTRYAAEGGVGNWSGSRKVISRLGTAVEKLFLRTELTDPLSGYFLMRRGLFEEAVRRMTGKGFKILLDLVLTVGRPLRTREFPYEFRVRQHGESKLDVVVALEYLYLLIDKSVGKFIPVRFILYVLAGMTGLALHLSVLWLLFRVGALPFVLAQALSTLSAMTSNFLVNNAVTFRPVRLKGLGFLAGLAVYVGICSVGAVVNIGISSYLYEARIPWWLAGVTGALIGAVWNYAVSTHIVWTWLPQGLGGKLRRGREA
jgi:dolichol-phosphate mannosyltransferase